MWKGLSGIGKGKNDNVNVAKYNHEGILLTDESQIIEAERKEIQEF